MSDFAYIARNLAGQQVSGLVSAATEREAVSALSAQDLFPVSVHEEKRLGHRPSPRVRPQLIATTYGQLAALLRSGVPPLRSLDVVREQSSHKGLVQILSDVHDQVEEGSNLADAMARHPRAFGEMATSIVRAGGEGGFLEEALERVASFTEQQDDLKSRVLGALAYPIFLSVVGTVIVNVLVIFFVPKFENLFSSLREKGELPAVTEGLLAASQAMRSWGWLAVAGLFFAYVVARNRLTTPQGRNWLDALKLKLPWAGSIYLNFAVARFCRVLGTLLSGGVPILRSLDISSTATGNRVLSSAIQAAAENISEGESLTRPLANCGHFPPTVIEMIAVAEESNTLDNVLTEVADSLERRTWRRLDLLVRMLEPVMLLILAGIVLIVVVALLLPVMKMSMAI